MASFYNIARARGGKHDIAIKRELELKISELKAGSAIKIKLDTSACWSGRDRVDIYSIDVNFIDRDDHTFSPVAIKSAVRVLHEFGFKGRFAIEVFGDTVIIQPLQVTNKDNKTTEVLQTVDSDSLDRNDDILLWEQVLANPIPLFKTSKHNPLIAIFDHKGFYFSEDADQIYKQIKSKPHIYVARSESENYLYFGISNQQGGRWKREHAYHLGTLAYEILGTKRYDDQNHRHWVEAWFLKNTYKYIKSESMYSIQMKERILISFFASKIHVAKRDLEKMESKLISIAKGKGLNVLNLKKAVKGKKENTKLSNKKNALFFIPCCSTKTEGGDYPAWDDVRYDQKLNEFQLLDNYRLQLIHFYSNLSLDDAFICLKNRGNTEDIRRKNAKHAWQTNLKILESRTMQAIDRYQGYLYKSINGNLIGQFGRNQITNVIIVSALLGLISPTDLIPNYELMMIDKIENKEVWRFWMNRLLNEKIRNKLKLLFSKFDYFYCLLSRSTGYINSVANLLPSYSSYIIIPKKSGQINKLRSWGDVLSEALLNKAYFPNDVEYIAQKYECKMEPLNSRMK